MARKKAENVEEVESLLPSVKEEEARLKAELETVRAQAERSAAEAELEAAERVRTARESLPSRTEERREAALRKLRSEADGLRKPEGEIERAVEAHARLRMDAAVKAILARVLPGGST